MNSRASRSQGNFDSVMVCQWPTGIFPSVQKANRMATGRTIRAMQRGCLFHGNPMIVSWENSREARDSWRNSHEFRYRTLLGLREPWISFRSFRKFPDDLAAGQENREAEFGERLDRAGFFALALAIAVGHGVA